MVRLKDKLSIASEALRGKTKETAGAATDNDGLRADGKTDQSKADLKRASERVSDAFSA